MKKILVLDDDIFLCRMLEKMFRYLGAKSFTEVHSVGELKEKQLLALQADIALLDVNLGEGNPSGVDAYQWQKGNRFSGGITFLSGHAQSHPLIQETLQDKSVTFLAKPASIQQLESLFNS